MLVAVGWGRAAGPAGGRLRLLAAGGGAFLGHPDPPVRLRGGHAQAGGEQLGLGALVRRQLPVGEPDPDDASQEPLGRGHDQLERQPPENRRQVSITVQVGIQVIGIMPGQTAMPHWRELADALLP